MLATVYHSKFLIDELNQSPFVRFVRRLIDICLAEGYSPRRIRHSLRGVVLFLRWSSAIHLSPKNLRKKHVDEYLKLLAVRIPTARASGLCYFSRRFFKVIEDETKEKLLEYHVSDISPQVNDSVEQYSKYLRDVRGLAESSFPRMTTMIKIFLSWKFGNQKINLKKLAAKDLLTFLQWRSKSRNPRTLQTESAALKSYCRYVFGRGLTQQDLSFSIPKIAGWRNQHHIETLTEVEIQHLLESRDQSNAQGLREFTILLLIIQYGLRGIEVARMQISDILWEQKKILIRGKGPKNAELPLTDNVVFALRRYIDCARPVANLNYLFLTTRAPFRRVDPKSGVSCVVARAMKKAGIKKAVLGAHILRATTASRVLNNGGTLRDAKELLRHSHMNTTARYYRVDFKRLSMVALPWPEKFARRK